MKKQSVRVLPRALWLLVAMIGLQLPRAAEAKFASIAYNVETGVYGFANEFDTRADAEERALQECGPGCKVVAWVENGCAVLAVGKNKSWGWAHDDTREEATRRALQECSKRGGGCAVKAWTCSG